jgi:hypothetical protein
LRFGVPAAGVTVNANTAGVTINNAAAGCNRLFSASPRNVNRAIRLVP